MGFLSGKRALIVGVASPRSIAAGIGHAMYREGAELAYTYQNEKLKSRVDQIAADTGSDLTMPLDVTSDEQIENVFTELEKHWDGLDIIVHAVGFARREELKGRFVDNVTRDGWALAQDISAYSFAALAQAGQKLMKGRNGSLLTLTYLGSIRALPFYNTMGPAKASLESCTRYLAQDLGPDGHRVNAISAGPIKTLAAAGISNFRKMLEHAEQQAPLRRSVSPEEVGNTAAFLCSDLASGITGEVIYVDAGYRNVAMAFEEG